jgi:hypothetical protein
MRASVFVVVLSSMLVGLCVEVESGSTKPAKDEAEWLTDYQAARAKAARLDKPIFVVFRCQH